MPGGGTSAFSEVEDFATALGTEGGLGLVVTEAGRFAARLTRVTLLHLDLAAADERLSRVAFVAAPSGRVLISFPLDDESRLIWGGMEVRAGEIATLGPGGQAHMRTEGPCRWGSIRLTASDLAGYGRALLGAAPALPGEPKCWCGPLVARRHLRQVHGAAIRAAETRPSRLTDSEAARGLEQQIIEAFIACLAQGTEPHGPVRHRNLDIAIRCEELLRVRPEASPPIAEIRTALGVSSAVLGACCRQQLGTSPARYLRLRRLQRLRQALVASNAGADGLAGPAQFTELGRPDTIS